MMALCGAAMAALLLSDPMVTAKVKSTVETVTARFGGRTGSESVFDDAPPAISSLGDLEEMSATPLKIRSQVSVDEGATDDPVVKAAPVVRVRRAGVLVEG